MPRLQTYALTLVVGLLAGAFAMTRTASADSSDNAMRIGLSLQPASALVMIALDQGYFPAAGLRISVEKYVSGARALRDGMFAGKVDLTSAADVPIVLNRFTRQDFSIVATIFRVDDINRIVVRQDKGIGKPADLRGKRIATQRGSAVHFFLHLFLLENNLTEAEVLLSFMKAEDMPAALARGDIDAFSMRSPYVEQATSLLGARAAVYASPGLYSQSEQVVIADSFLKNRPDAAARVVRALLNAEKFAADKPGKSHEIVAGYLGVRTAEIAATWPGVVPRVSLGQPLLLRLEDIGRWAVKRHLVKSQRMPNFLKLIYFDALHAVRPAAITVIR